MHARILSSVIPFLTAFYLFTSIPEHLTIVAAHTFADIMSYEDTLKEKFRAEFNSIVGAKNKWRFL